MNARTKPLAPLSPESTQPLGATESILVGLDGRLDQRADAWLIGKGAVTTGGPTSKRETLIRVWLLPAGMLLTNVTVTTTSDGVSVETASTGRYHETPQGALNWLIEQGKGRLGPASKAAWVMACQKFGPMNGMEHDVAAETEQDRLLQELGTLSSEWFVLHGADWAGHSMMRFPDGPSLPSPNGHFRLRFEWKGQPPHSPARGEFHVTIEAAKVLAGMPQRARLGAIRQVVERKYLAAGSSFQPIGSPWPILADDLKSVMVR